MILDREAEHATEICRAADGNQCTARLDELAKLGSRFILRDHAQPVPVWLGNRANIRLTWPTFPSPNCSVWKHDDIVIALQVAGIEVTGVHSLIRKFELLENPTNPA